MSIITLLVEDDINVRFTIKAMLQEMGITDITEAKDGESALKTLQDSFGTWQLVLCDWNMPNKTGLQFLQDVRAMSPDLPFIMITARADEASILDAKSSRVTAYIRKPFSQKELRAKIASVVKVPMPKVP